MAAFSLPSSRQPHTLVLTTVPTQHDDQAYAIEPLYTCDHAPAQKVSYVWQQAMATGEASPLPSRKARAFGRTAREQQVSSFAAQFAPPVRQTPNSIHLLTPMTRFCLIASLVNFVPLMLIVDPISGLGKLLFCLFVAFSLGVLFQNSRFSLHGDSAKRQQERFAQATRSWHEAIRRWDSMHYCSKCGSVYDLESGETMSLGEMRNRLQADSTQ